ncbi:MAG: NYN domain-containing protein [Nanoarchaeota archaeon]|nr:NYN domain-containing protein [Nanoarchaeota archaeon]MBU1103398.1 NYN domain-containing protein [Nanoarchaeota archaeon]
MEDTIMFVDNGFFKLVKKEIEARTKSKKKLLQTFRNICEKEKLYLKHLFFYTAPPYQSESPTEKEKNLIKSYRYLLKFLKYKKWITVREGRCQRLKIDGEFTYKQKGVDILISIDMMETPNRYPGIKKIILIACDSDFVPVIGIMKSKGINVILYTYFDRKRNSSFSKYNELLKAASKWVKLEEVDFEDKK